MYMLPSAAVEVRRRGVEWSRGSAGQSGSQRLGRLQLPKCTAASQPRGPGSRDPLASRSRCPVPTLRFPRLGSLGCVAPGFSSARGRPRSPSSACPALPFGAFPAVGVLFKAAQKRGRPKPNPASGQRGRILCKWTAWV